MGCTQVVRGAATQYGNIIVDQATGERTIFWDRDARLMVQPKEIKPAAITSARLLHLDGCDVDAALVAARLPTARTFRWWRTLTPFTRTWRSSSPTSTI